MPDVAGIDFATYARTKVPEIDRDLGLQATLLPCIRGSMEMPSRMPSPTGIMCVMDSRCHIAPEARGRVDIVLPPLTCLIRVQSSKPRAFALGIVGRILSYNGQDYNFQDQGRWLAIYTGNTTGVPMLTVEDFLQVQDPYMEIAPREGVHPGSREVNEIIERIEAWDDGRLVGWSTLLHRVTREP